jgi:hypothetical protein
VDAVAGYVVFGVGAAVAAAALSVWFYLRRARQRPKGGRRW